MCDPIPCPASNLIQHPMFLPRISVDNHSTFVLRFTCFTKKPHKTVKRVPSHRVQNLFFVMQEVELVKDAK